MKPAWKVAWCLGETLLIGPGQVESREGNLWRTRLCQPRDPLACKRRSAGLVDGGAYAGIQPCCRRDKSQRDVSRVSRIVGTILSPRPQDRMLLRRSVTAQLLNEDPPVAFAGGS